MFLFGPVPSRRLGRSLGVDPIPFKRCSFNCIYCQLGKTTDLTTQIQPYGNIDEFKSELMLWLKNDGNANYITFAGSGEPTLNSLLKDMILITKELTDIPIAVLSNGSLFHMKSIRESIMPAQYIKATLNTANEKTFKKIHQPAENISFERHIEGLVAMREERKEGLYCIEVMIINGVNDSLDEISRLSELIQKIRPDWIDINTPTRPTHNPTINPVEFEKLKEIQRLINYPSRILTPFKGEFEPLHISDDEFVDIVARHPDTCENLALMLGMTTEKTKEYLEKLVRENKLVKEKNNRTTYYCAVRRGQK